MSLSECPQFWQADDDNGQIWTEAEKLMAVEVANPDMEMPSSFEVLKESDVWICDSGASSHSTHCKMGGKNERAAGDPTLGQSGAAVSTTCTIDIEGRFINKDGSLEIKGILKDVGFNKSLNFNLMSLTRMLVNGWHIVKGDENGIKIGNKKGEIVSFDIVVKTARGAIFACRFLRNKEIGGVSAEKEMVLNIQKAHALLGHGNEEDTRSTAKALGWAITKGTLKPCAACAISKAKQKNVVKKSESIKSKVPGEKCYLDLSKLTVPKSDGKDYEIENKWWKIIVDEATGKKWSDFTTSKNGMVERTCEWLNGMKARGIHVKKIRMDPAGENEKLMRRAQEADWASLQPIDFEVTSRETPQHNSLAKLAFQYLAGKARAMMNAAHIPDGFRGKLAVEVIKLATQLDGLRTVTLNDKKETREMHVYGENPKWISNMRIFGEAGVVKSEKIKDGKVGDRGIPMMFVGYPLN